MTIIFSFPLSIPKFSHRLLPSFSLNFMSSLSLIYTKEHLCVCVCVYASAFVCQTHTHTYTQKIFCLLCTPRFYMGSDIVNSSPPVCKPSSFFCKPSLKSQRTLLLHLKCYSPAMLCLIKISLVYQCSTVPAKQTCSRDDPRFVNQVCLPRNMTKGWLHFCFSALVCG